MEYFGLGGTTTTADLQKEIENLKKERANLTSSLDKMSLDNAALNNRTSQLAVQNTRLTDEFLHLSDQVKRFSSLIDENRQLKESVAKLAFEKSTYDLSLNQTLTRM